jgi:hypothetical protein
MIQAVLTCYPYSVNGDANHRSFPSSAQLLVVEEKTEAESGRDLNKIVEETVEYSSPEVERVRIQRCLEGKEYFWREET